jgi:hypothetical protein
MTPLRQTCGDNESTAIPQRSVTLGGDVAIDLGIAHSDAAFERAPTNIRTETV